MAVLGFALLCVGVFYTMLLYQASDIENDIRAVDAYLFSDEVSEKRQQTESVMAEIQSLRQYSLTIDGLYNELQSQNTQSAYIEMISTIIPPEVTFSNLSLESNTLTIQASSSSRIAIAEFLYNVKTASFIESYNLENISSSDTHNISITCSLRK